MALFDGQVFDHQDLKSRISDNHDFGNRVGGKLTFDNQTMEYGVIEEFGATSDPMGGLLYSALPPSDDRPLATSRVSGGRSTACANQLAMTRIYQALLREDWSAEELQLLKQCSATQKRVEMVRANLWAPNLLELYLFDRDPSGKRQLLDEDVRQDVAYHLETDRCRRSWRLLRLLSRDAGLRRLADRLEAAIENEGEPTTEHGLQDALHGALASCPPTPGAVLANRRSLAWSFQDGAGRAFVYRKSNPRQPAKESSGGENAAAKVDLSKPRKVATKRRCGPDFRLSVDGRGSADVAKDFSSARDFRPATRFRFRLDTNHWRPATMVRVLIGGAEGEVLQNRLAVVCDGGQASRMAWLEFDLAEGPPASAVIVIRKVTPDELDEGDLVDLRRLIEAATYEESMTIHYCQQWARQAIAKNPVKPAVAKALSQLFANEANE